MACARHETIAGEVQLAVNCMKEAEVVLQKRQHEVAVAKLHLQEAEEHIGWAQEHFRYRKLQRLSQAPILTKTQSSESFVSSGYTSHASTTSVNTEEGDPSFDYNGVSNMEANGAEGGGNGNDFQDPIIPLTVATLNKLEEQLEASLRSSN
jgi:hypothetical protein